MQQYTYRLRATVTVADPDLLLHAASAVALRVDEPTPTGPDDAVTLLLSKEEEEVTQYPEEYGLYITDAVTLVHREMEPLTDWLHAPFAGPPTGTLLMHVDSDESRVDPYVITS